MVYSLLAGDTTVIQSKRRICGAQHWGRKMKIRTYSRLGFYAVAAIMVLSACGSSDSSPGDSAGSDSTVVDTTVAPDVPPKSPVTVVAIVNVTGVGAGSGPFIPDVINAWATFINNKGGLNGHPVEVDVQDTKGDAAVSQSIIEAGLAKNPVLWLLDDPFTESAMAASLGATGIPVMGLGYAPAVWGGYIASMKYPCDPKPKSAFPCALPNAFPLSTTFGAVVESAAFVAKDQGATKVVFAACAEADSCSAAAPVFSLQTKALGLADAGLTKVSSSAADYNAECLVWIEAKVDFINMGVDGFAAGKIMANCLEQGYKGLFAASHGSVAGAMLTGPDLVGALNGFPWWVDDAPVVEYRDAMQAAGVAKEGYENPTATGMWAAMQMFAKAQAAMSDAPTAAEALANMYTIKAETLGGLVSSTTWTQGELAGARACWWNYTLKAGVLANPLGGLTHQCNPAE